MSKAKTYIASITVTFEVRSDYNDIKKIEEKLKKDGGHYDFCQVGGEFLSYTKDRAKTIVSVCEKPKRNRLKHA